MAYERFKICVGDNPAVAEGDPGGVESIGLSAQCLSSGSGWRQAFPQAIRNLSWPDAGQWREQKVNSLGRRLATIDPCPGDLFRESNVTEPDVGHDRTVLCPPRAPERLEDEAPEGGILQAPLGVNADGSLRRWAASPRRDFPGHWTFPRI